MIIKTNSKLYRGNTVGIFQPWDKLLLGIRKTHRLLNSRGSTKKERQTMPKIKRKRKGKKILPPSAATPGGDTKAATRQSVKDRTQTVSVTKVVFHLSDGSEIEETYPTVIHWSEGKRGFELSGKVYPDEVKHG